MKKTCIRIIVLMLFSILFTGCGIGKVNEKNIIKDLIGKFFYLSGDEIFGGQKWNIKSDEIKDFNINKISIDKDAKQEIIFTQIKLEYEKVNEETGEISTYGTSGELRNTYNYYEKGGWVLERIERASLEPWKVTVTGTGEYAPLADLEITEDKIYQDILGSTIFITVGSKKRYEYDMELFKETLKSVKILSTSADEKERKRYVEFEFEASSNYEFYDAINGEYFTGYNYKGKGKLYYKYSDLDGSWKKEVQEITRIDNTTPSKSTDSKETTKEITKEQAKELVSKKLGEAFEFAGDEINQGTIEEFNGMKCYSFYLVEMITFKGSTFYVEISGGRIFNEFGYEFE